MTILKCQIISDSSKIPPKIYVLILDDNDKIIEYNSIEISSHEIQDLYANTGMMNINELIKFKIKKHSGEELTLEKAVYDHPAIKESIVHLLRDKKINDLLL